MATLRVLAHSKRISMDLTVESKAGDGSGGCSKSNNYAVLTSYGLHKNNCWLTPGEARTLRDWLSRHIDRQEKG